MEGVPDGEQAKPALDHDLGIAGANTARVHNLDAARLTADRPLGATITGHSSKGRHWAGRIPAAADCLRSWAPSPLHRGPWASSKARHKPDQIATIM